MAPTEKKKEEQGWLKFGEDCPPALGGRAEKRSGRKSGKAAGDYPTGETDSFNAELFRSLIMSAGEGLCGVDLSGTCTFCNPAAAALLRFPDAEEAVGKSLHELVHGGVADGLQCESGFCRIVDGMREGKGAHLKGEVFWRNDGNAFPVECRSHPVFRNGEVVGAIVSFSDITEHKRADAAMRASEERFRSLFEQTSIGMAIFNPEGRYLAVNRAFCAMLGYTEDELLKLKYDEITLEEDRKASLERNRRIRAGKMDHYDVEKRYVRKDGHVIWVALSASTIRDAGGTPIFNIRQAQDITEKKRAMEALRKSEARFRAFIDNSAAAINLKNVDGEYLLVNRAFEDYYQINSEQTRGKTVFDVFPPHLAAIYAAVDREVVETGTTREFETQILFPDGTTHTLLVTKFPVTDAHGDVSGIGTIGTDITERKKAEDALRQSDERLRDAVDSLQEGFGLFDKDDRLVVINAFYKTLNPAAAKAVEEGLTFEDLLRANVSRGILAEAVGREEEFVAERLRKHRNPGDPIVRGFSDGRFFLLKETRTPADGIALTVVDITEQKKAEQAVRDAQSRLNTILSSAPVVLWATDGDGVFTLSCGKGLEALDMEPDEVVGRSVFEVFEDNPAIVLNMRRALAGETVDATARIGDRFFGIRYEPIIGMKGQVIGSVAAAIDTTEQRRAELAMREREEQLRAVIENSPAAICFQDTEGRFLLFNREFEKRHGLSLDDARGKRPPEVFPEDVVRIVSMNDEIVLDTELPCEYEVEFPDQYNVIRTGFTNKFPIYGPQGGVVGIGSICADMTDHKQMEEKLRHAQKLEAVGQLTGGVAHDFNNILAVILTNLEFLEEDLEGDSAHKEIISEAIRAVHRGAKLTERLLAFSRKQPLNPKTIDLISILSEMVELLRRTLGETITVQTQFPGDLRPVFVDRNQFENAVLNLAVNARDAMKRGGKLEIICSNKKIIRRASGRINEMPSGHYVCMEIRDSGEGMPPEVMERAFEPFFTTKKTGEGSGLGLSMVYGFANQSGGAVTISSVLGEGTSVKLFLPAIPADGSEPVLEPESDPEPVATNVPRGSETILVVEDDADVGSSARRTLTSLGYRVFCASDAIDALEILRRTPRIDLLFSDVIMPGGVDGRELAEEAKRLLPGLNIVLTSGYAAGRLSHVDLEKAGIGFVPKPYTRRTLADVIRAVLDRPRDAEN